VFSIQQVLPLRAGELLGLTVNDIDFDRKLILPRRQADDRTRQLRELKTKKSQSPVAMTPTVEAALRDHMTRLQSNPLGLLFPSRTGKPRKRGYVIKFGLASGVEETGVAESRAPCVPSWSRYRTRQQQGIAEARAEHFATRRFANNVPLLRTR
jgi:integrase